MNTVRVQQKALSTALLHTSQDKKNKEMQNNTLWMKMKSTKLFLRISFLKTTNHVHDYDPLIPLLIAKV